MIPSQAYIIRISTQLSREYADSCARSCEHVGLPYEFYDGVEGQSNYNAWMDSGLDVKPGSLDHRRNQKDIDPAACCSVSHALIWKRVAESSQCAVILEHDALMLHPIDIDIPDGKIIVLGYKLSDPKQYNHIKAGPPTTISDVYYHHGAHAYAITPKTASMLLDEIRTVGGGGPIDNRFFMRERWSKIPLMIADPTPAIGWIRESTIWPKADREIGPLIGSFERHLKG